MVNMIQEHKEDYPKIREVIQQAFEQEDRSDQTEHLLVERIRKTHDYIPELSLVARQEEDGTIVGQCMLSKCTITNQDQRFDSLALAPVSVIPTYQKSGIGTALINESIKRAKDMGFKSIIVLGHPHYYKKFGFKNASHYNIKAPFEVPDEAFMVLELQQDALHEVTGTVQYSSAFM